ncbi:hypothetical protein L210DRAFT_1011323 [Boletus edulis BED1]|uniref:Uncharacterized protein n=1 Tax=Boletus edulis BED1 TaxID=1328754 RepID=A0AAD4GL10_BOLED|nr:hypothetical protein L210DRAFT_1011323 [Boletus edulis BED1]
MQLTKMVHLPAGATAPLTTVDQQFIDLSTCCLSSSFRPLLPYCGTFGQQYTT